MAHGVLARQKWKKGEERPAGARTEQGQRDNHEGEMVEMRDGKQAGERYLKEKDNGR